MGISGCSKIKMPCSRLGERLSLSTLIWRPSPLGLSQCADPTLFVPLTVSYLHHVWVTLLRPHGLWMSRDGKEAEEVLRRQSTRQQLTFPDLFHIGFTHYIKEISLSSYLPSLSPSFFFLFAEPRVSLRIGTNSFSGKLIEQLAPSHIQFPLLFPLRLWLLQNRYCQAACLRQQTGSYSHTQQRR